MSQEERGTKSLWILLHAQNKTAGTEANPSK